LSEGLEAMYKVKLQKDLWLSCMKIR